MDTDQIKVLYVYSLYTSENQLTYLQYTAALAIFFYLMEKGHFPNYQHQLLLYDYKDSRRYLWEDKKFMQDVNIIRDRGFLNRSRVKTTDYRDINAHQCTENGQNFIHTVTDEYSDTFQSIHQDLICDNCNKLLHVLLREDAPHLSCPEECTNIQIAGFIGDVYSSIEINFLPSFI